MSKLLKPLVLVIFFLALNQLHAQDLDSMRMEVLSLEGIEKIDLLNDIAYYFPIEAKKEAELALMLSEKLNYELGVATAYDMLGEHYDFIGDTEKSRLNRQKGIDLYSKLNRDDLVFSSMIPLIYLDVEERDYFSALRKGLELSRLAEEFEDSLYLADAYTTMARIYAEGMLNLKESIAFLHKGRVIYENNLSTRDLIGVYNDLGSDYEEMEKLDTAQINYEKGLTLARQLYETDLEFDRSDLSLLLTNMASVLAQKGEYDEAKKYGLEALARYFEAEYIYYYPNILFNVANSYYYLGQKDSAFVYLNKAHSIAKELNSSLDLEQIYGLYKEIYKNEKDFPNALKFHELYQLTRDSIYNGERAANLEWIRAQYELGKVEKENNLLNLRLRLTLVIGFLMILMIGLGWFFYEKLRSKNKTIQIQNLELEKLNTTKNKLFAIIGHDFKGSLLGFQNMASNIAYLFKKNQPERVQAMGNMIDEQVMRLRRQLDNLLNWAMKETKQMPYKPEAFFIATIAGDGFESFLNFAKEKKIKVTWNIEKKIEVFADKQAIELVARNLLSNALKFTPKGGEIYITATKKTPWVLFSIADTGVGIPPEKMNTIFEVDSHKSSAGTEGEKGTGLGLVVCKELLKVNKGKITIESELGKGTKVQLFIPIP
ncbi:MAG: tetratricopeptide repeat-containing sensor histidine kinase [Bacteroidetes bacterium]|jgi:signal transduction histidine kinase|nr:tetratricopeptide repeat-containing sensor histidine kinase [Bacteroidota bacterium]MDF1865294.1 tetratricopeptide repeat-containing sensor histidine kinase [Saprospiraceae bacterium]